MKVVVYTAVIPDNFDSHKLQPMQTVETDFMRFNPTYSLPESVKRLHPRMQAKYFKLQPHKLHELDRYDYSIWIDGSAQILSDKFVEEMIERADKGFMVFKHPESRDCIYQEAGYCQNMPKYLGQPIANQIDCYNEAGYPKHNGLYACGMIVRKHKSFLNRFLSDMWWKECKEWTYQDQLSLPFVLWKYKIDINILELDQYNNSFITFNNPHTTIL